MNDMNKFPCYQTPKIAQQRMIRVQSYYDI